jgi:hypothetical protein
MQGPPSQTVANPTTTLRERATASSNCDPSLYAFQAQSFYIVGGVPIEKCLLGSVNYANRCMRITLAHKLEEWLFCAEENLLVGEGVYVGAFHQGRHYSFERLCDAGLPLKEEAAAFQRWIFNRVLGLFYPQGLSVRLGEGEDTLVRLEPHRLKEKRVVPNEQAVSLFLRENPALLPPL